jgi:hypothetical protein
MIREALHSIAHEIDVACRVFDTSADLRDLALSLKVIETEAADLWKKIETFAPNTPRYIHESKSLSPEQFLREVGLL